MIVEEFIYMEKLDGTNIAKDANGCIYKRQTKLDKLFNKFIGTGLGNVKKIDVKSFHDLMRNKVSDRYTIVFGELMCNDINHDYIERGMGG